MILYRICLLVVTLTTIFHLQAIHFWGGTTLAEDKIIKKWGKSALNLEKFKGGNEKEKASMAHSIVLEKKNFIGKHVSEIRSAFGKPDGFYYKDVFPAYIIESGKNPKEDTWQIVFELDSQRKVTDIFVHKNCCYQNN